MSQFLPKRKGFIPGLDGIRFLAIFMVIIHHCSFNYEGDSIFLIKRLTTLGGNGVDLFFILSGFLITKILLENKGSKNYFKAFYMRRILRIFPLYYLLLIITFIVLPQFQHPYLEKWKDIDQIWYWLFLSNFAIAEKGSFGHGMVDNTWSLAIEEQFYLVWPFISSQLSLKNLRIFSWIVILFTIIYRSYLFLNGESFVSIYVSTFTRMDNLAMGSLLATYYTNHDWEKVVAWTRYTIIPSILFFLFNIFAVIYIDLAVFGAIGYIMNLVIFTTIIVLALDERPAFQKFLNINLLSKIGVYSYGIYLIHNPLQKMIRVFLINNLDLSATFKLILLTVITLITSTVIAWVSFHFFEMKFNSLKKHFKY